MDEDFLSSLVLDHLVNALQLAVAAVDLVDVPDAATLSQLRDIETMRERLEIGTVMLLQQAGVSWEVMAGYSGGVTRQSLHRRLNRKVAERIAYKPEKSDRPGLQTYWSRALEYLRIRIETLEMDRPERISGRIARSLLTQGTTSQK